MTEKEPKRGLFLGRFQPYHNGHHKTVEKMAAASDLDEIILGIGTAQISNHPYNPFSGDEREMMIRTSLENEIGKPYHVIPIDDINDFSRWVAHVESLCPSFDVVYGGNTITKTLFEDAGYEVRSPFGEASNSGTKLRNLMIRGGEWEDRVPLGTAKVIIDIGGVQRVKDLNSTYKKADNTVDVIISRNGGIVLIKRKNEPFKGKWALPGGYLNVGDENLEEAAVREVEEETNLVVKKEDLHFVGVYSEPGRDPRGPTVTAAYYATSAEGELKAKDDAADIGTFGVLPDDLAFDHKKILEDYRKVMEKKK